MADSLIDIARQLYAVPLAEFTPTRNARAKELRDADAELSRRVTALRKASPAAWAVNSLARERKEQLGDLFAIGGAMRSAQEDLDRDALTRLGRQRRDAVGTLVNEARSLAAEHGQKLSASVVTEIEQTLLAATVDGDAAEAVSSGRLIRSLDASGFEQVDLDEAVAAPDPGTRAAKIPTPPVDIADARKRSQARKETARLESEANAAQSQLTQVTRKLERTEAQRAQLAEELDQLREKLGAAEADLMALTEVEEALAADRDRLEKVAAEAERLADEARAALQ
jgi:DNA repair exonuclease SbcCD ATPase subunit